MNTDCQPGAYRISRVENQRREEPKSELEPHPTNESIETQSSGNTDDKGSFQDPASAQNRTVPVHRWVPWVAGYSQAFTANAIDRFANGATQLILDPFAGVGTTLLEANRLGHRAVGFEINPYATFAASIKLQCHRVDTVQLRESIQRLSDFHLSSDEHQPEPTSTPPQGFKTRDPFYSPNVLKKVLQFMDFVREERREHEEIANLWRLAFAATMVEYSNYSYEPSLGRKRTVGRPEVTDFPVFEFMAEKLHQFADDADWFRENRAPYPKEDALIYRASFLNDYRRVGKHRADLMITSPPYMNNYHYNRNTRPQMYWLDFYGSPEELKTLERMNFGTSWQVARDQEPITLNPVIQNQEIRNTLDTIREQNPEGKNNGGKGWANYATSYLNDCVRFMKALRWTLHPKGTGLIVIGNSIIQGIPVPTDRFLATIAEECGLQVRSISTPRQTRVGDSIVNSTVRNGQVEEGNHLYESVVEIGQGT